MTTTTMTTMMTKANTSSKGALPSRETITLKVRLANLRDELEVFGWKREDTRRYARNALKALPMKSVIGLFEELVDEERTYYAHHAPLADDQLDHTLLS